MPSYNSTDIRTRLVATSLQSLSFSDETCAKAYRLLRTTKATSRHSKNGNLFASDRYSSMGAQQPQSISEPPFDDSTLAMVVNTLSRVLAAAVERKAGMRCTRLTVVSLERRSPVTTK